MSYGIYLVKREKVLGLFGAAVAGDRNADRIVQIVGRMIKTLDAPRGEGPLCLFCDAEPGLDAEIIGAIVPLDEKGDDGRGFCTCRACSTRSDLEAAVRAKISDAYGVEVAEVSRQEGTA